MSLFSSVPFLPVAFVVGVVSDEVVIYKIFKKRKVYKTFHQALFFGGFSEVVVFYNQNRLINFLRNLENFNGFQIKIID